MTKNLADELQRSAHKAFAGVQPYPQGEEPGGLPLRRLLAAFFRARFLVFGTTLFGVLVGTFLAITTANRYVSAGMFLFTGSGAEARIIDPTQSKETSQETIATGAAYILNSDDLLRRVVDRLGPGRILQPYQPGSVDDELGPKALFFRIQRDWNAVRPEDVSTDGAMRQLQKSIFVERPRFTDVLLTTCTANDPKLAQEILATFMDEAVKWHIEKYDDRRAYEEAQRAFEESVVQFDTARRALREFLDRKARVTEFDSELERLRLDYAEAAARVTRLEDDLKIEQTLLEKFNQRLDPDSPEAIPQYVSRRVRQGASSGEIAQLEQLSVTVNLELHRLKSRYADPNAPEIRTKQEELETIRQTVKTLKNEALTAPMVEEPVRNENYDRTIASRIETEGKITSLAAQLDQAREQLQEKNERLHRLLDLEPEFETLRQNELLARDTKEAAQGNWIAAQKKRALGAGQFSSLKAVQAASLPLEKDGPNRGKTLIGGLLVGLFLGLGLVVLRTLPDNVVRTREDVEGIEGLAVIGVVPRLDRVNLRRHLALREQGW